MGNSKPRKGSARQAKGALPPDIGLLLQEIEKEAVPERLLQLAVKLQEALARQRAAEETPEPVQRRRVAG